MHKKILLFLITSIVFISCDYREVIMLDNAQTNGIYERHPEGKTFEAYEGDQRFRLETTTCISSKDFKEVVREKQDDGGLYTLSINLTPQAIKAFKELTERNLGRELYLVAKGKVIMAPILRTPIENGQMSITVSSLDEMEELVSRIEK